MTNKSGLYSIVGVGLTGLVRHYAFGSKSKKSVFTDDIALVGSRMLADNLKKANVGLANGSVEGVEICGDSYKLCGILSDNSINAIITSPPYYGMRDYGNKPSKEVGAQKTREEYVNSLVQMFVDLKPKLKDNGVIVVNIDATARWDTEEVRGIPEEFVEKMEKNGFYKKFNLVWKKANYGRHSSVSTPGKNFEHIYGFIKKGQKKINFNQLLIPTKDNKDWRVSVDVFEENGVQHSEWNASDTERFMIRFPERNDISFHLMNTGFKHPAPMNPRVAWRLVQYFSSPGDIILDPFSGAGTINIVAKRLGRKAVGFELSHVNSMVSVIGERFFSGNSVENIHESFKISGKPRNPAYPGGTGIKDGAYHPKKVKNYNPKKTMWIDASTVK